MSHVPTAEPVPGTIIDNKYRIESLLGEGGMGRVYRVTHIQLDKIFALKLMHFNQSDTDPNRMIRFRREAEALAKINHPNVVMITDFGIMPNLQLPYIVMEFIEGATLRQLLNESGTLNEKQAMHIIKQMCAGLHEAHSHGIIHRDLKPENIMIQQFTDGEMMARVLDFGIAKLMRRANDAAGKSVTGGGEMAGTLKYIAPEQFFGLPIDARADIFNICLILYESLTGVVPPVMMGRFKSLSEMRPGATPRLNDIVLKGLSQSPDQRPQTALELKRELESIEYEAVVETVMEKNKAPSASALSAVANQTLSNVRSNTGPLQLNSATNPNITNSTLESAQPRRAPYFTVTLILLLALGGVAGWYFYPKLIGGSETTSGSNVPESAIPQLIEIKGNKFNMGSNKGDPYVQPEHSVTIEPFQVARFLVTNRQYAEFVKQTGYQPPKHWGNREPSSDVLEKPVTYVTWNDAKAYCDWLVKVTQKPYRLLTEPEWEYLGRNTTQFGINELLTEYLEWTSSEFYLYPGSKAKITEELARIRTHIFRGNDGQSPDPVTFRMWQPGDYTDPKLGFRVACDVAKNSQ
ncbi:MAG: bifunctional serine/threonine-protein kinase/formylglycine-generating enzyme family protein [Acidobacteriota bacterium]